MEKLLSVAQMRAADSFTIENLGVLSETLMERAGKAIADEVEKIYAERGGTVTVVCGTGNNGGDGYVCANSLLSRGINVKVYAAEGRLSPDCLREKNAYNGEYLKDITGSIVVDCLFGTGLSRGIEGENRKIIQKINALGAYVISADIPSGLNGDNGLIMGEAVKADLTVCIQEYKAGLFLNDGLDYCGEIIKKDIGISLNERNFVQIYDNFDIACFFPERKRNSHKGTFGAANLVAGCDRFIGAAVLSSQAALKSGCGLVRLTSQESDVKKAVCIAAPQVTFLNSVDLTCQAIAIGMGCGASEQLYKTICGILNVYKGTLIIDADGLNSIAKFGTGILINKTCNVVITPHIKEFSSLTGESVEEILSSPVEKAQKFAKEHKITVLLKSAASVITDGERTALNVRGGTALAKGGSGDMLSGFLCGLAARGLGAFDAAVCAQYVLGVAAEIAEREKTAYCAVAADILNNLHLAVKEITKNK